MSSSEVGGQKAEVRGPMFGSGDVLAWGVQLAVAAWDKDCQEPDLLRMYVAPVVGKTSLALQLDEEWTATLQEWEACGADEAYLPDFVLAYAEVATGLVAVG